MSKEFQPFSIDSISPHNPLPNHEHYINEIKHKGTQATAVIYNGGTARFQGMAGALCRMLRAGIMPQQLDLQIGTSAGSVIELLENLYELDDPQVLDAIEGHIKSMSGIIPWSKLLRLSDDRRSFVMDLEKFSNKYLVGLPVRGDLLEKMKHTLIIITSGKYTKDGYIPALTSDKQIAQSNYDPLIVARILREAAEVSCSMPPLLKPYIHPETEEKYGDGALPGHQSYGNNSFGKRWEIDLAKAIMPDGSTIIVFEPLPLGKNMKDSGVYFEKDVQMRDIVTIVPTNSGVFGRRNIDAALRFSPRKFDIGYKAVMPHEEKIREILSKC